MRKGLQVSHRLIESILTGLMMVLGAIPTPQATIDYIKPIEVQAYESSLTESLPEMIDRIALSKGIATTTLYNLALSESSLGEQRVGDKGKSCGVVHFHKDYYPEENSRCEDDEYILTRASEMIASGEEWKFTPCNCHAFARVLLGSLPKMADIVPNTKFPRKNGLLIFNYKGLKHIAVIEKVSEEGIWVREANYKPCLTERRLVDFSDPNIVGYWHSVD